MRTRAFFVAGALALWLPARVLAQPTQKLYSQNASGSITVNGGSVEMLNTGGLGTLRVQVPDSAVYTGTWKVQCSSAPAGATPVYGTNGINLSLEGASSAAVQSVTSAVGMWKADISGCTAVKVLATSAYTGTQTVYLSAISTGGSAGGGGGSTTVASDGATGSAVPSSANFEGVNVGGTLRGVTGLGVGTAFAPTVAIVDSSGNQISTFGGSGGTSVNEDVASADAQPGTPAFSVRNNTLTGATSTDGDYQPLKSTAAGAVYTAPTYGDTVAAVNNGAASAQTPRVTIANDSTGVLASIGAISTSVTPGTAAGNLGKAEDAVAGSGDTGIGMLAVREDTPTSTASGSGDYIHIKADALGKLFTAHSFAEDAAHTSGDSGAFVLAIRRDTTPSSSSGTAGDYSAINVDGNGRVYTNTTLYNSSGTELTPATDKAEDAAHSSGDTGPVILAKRTDAAAVSSGTDGDYSTVNVDALGQVWTRQLDPCTGVAKSTFVFNISTATTTEITPSLAGASNNYYVCSIVLVTAAANNVAITDDDSDGCGSVTSGLAGGTTSGSGFNLAANGGLTLGNGGSTVMKTNGTNRVICFVTSAATQLSGVLTAVAAP